MGCHSLLQGMFPTQGSNPCLLPCRQILYRLSHRKAMILVFLIFSFKTYFSLSSFTLIKRLFSSSSLSAIRVVLSTYLRLLMFLPPIFIPACNSSSLACLMRGSVCRLNKQDDNRQPCRTSLSILNQSVVPHRLLIVSS